MVTTADAREVRLELARARARDALASCGMTEPAHLDLDRLAASVGAEVVLDDLEGSTARVIRFGDRARIVVSTRIPDAGAIRFSTAHEISHLLCKHTVRRAGVDRPLERVCSPLSVDGSILEREASVCAAELLMPAPMVAPWITAAPSSLEPIQAIATTFQTSLLASAMRFVELTAERCAVVYTELKRVRWVKRSAAFTSWIPKGKALDPASVAFEYFERGTIEHPTRIVPASAWLSRDDGPTDAPIYEHATAIPGTGTVFVVLWLPS